MFHLAAFLFYSLLSVVFLRPLLPVWSASIPGALEDTRLFLWNAWWFRYAIDTLHTTPFFTQLLFHPFGCSLISHDFPMWTNGITYAAQNFGLNWIAASNVWFILTWILSGFCSYLLVWEVTQKRAPAVVAGLYVMTHSYTLARAMQNWGQFNLYGIALFLWLLVRARKQNHRSAYVLSGMALAWTAACHYYFLIYSGAIWMASLLMWAGPGYRFIRRAPLKAIRYTCLMIAALAASAAAWIVGLHPGMIVVGHAKISLQTPVNALLVMWLALMGAWACGYRLEKTRLSSGFSPELKRRLINEAALIGTALVCLSPLFWGAFQLALSGGYPKQGILWKTHLPGANLLALFSPNPIHALWGPGISRWFEVHGMNAQEQAAGIGWVCLAVILGSRIWQESKRWLILAVSATVLAMGTYLHILQHNLWLPLPFYVWRLLPVLGNVRVPERWMAVGAIAWGVVLGLGLVLLAKKKSWPLNRLCAVVGVLILLENWPGLPVGEPPPDNSVYQTLRRQPAGGVLPIPLYIGDSSIGAGHAPPGLIWDYLVFQIYHQHPVLGGYVGRIQRQLITNYKDDPFFARLIDLEEEKPVSTEPLAVGQGCQSLKQFDAAYVLLYPAAINRSTLEFIQQTLPLEAVLKEKDVELYRTACPQ